MPEGADITTTEALIVIGVGFGSALLGVVATVGTFLLVARRERLQTRSRRKPLVESLMVELLSLRDEVMAALLASRRMNPFVPSVWEGDSRTQLEEFLPIEVRLRVRRIYGFVVDIERALALKEAVRGAMSALADKQALWDRVIGEPHEDDDAALEGLIPGVTTRRGDDELINEMKTKERSEVLDLWKEVMGWVELIGSWEVDLVDTVKAIKSASGFGEELSEVETKFGQILAREPTDA